MGGESRAGRGRCLGKAWRGLPRSGLVWSARVCLPVLIDRGSTGQRDGTGRDLRLTMARLRSSPAPAASHRPQRAALAAKASAWLGLDWIGLARFGLDWIGLAWLAWFGLAWLGLAWLGLAWLGLAWLGLAWAWLGLAWAWLGLDWLGSDWLGLAWLGWLGLA